MQNNMENESESFVAAVVQKRSNMMFLGISQNWQENTCIKVFF